MTMLDSRAVSREEIPAVLFNYKTKRTVSEMFFRLKCAFINSELLITDLADLRFCSFLGFEKCETCQSMLQSSQVKRTPKMPLMNLLFKS